VCFLVFRGTKFDEIETGSNWCPFVIFTVPIYPITADRLNAIKKSFYLLTSDIVNC